MFRNGKLMPEAVLMSFTLFEAYCSYLAQ